MLGDNLARFCDIMLCDAIKLSQHSTEKRRKKKQKIIKWGCSILINETDVLMIESVRVKISIVRNVQQKSVGLAVASAEQIIKNEFSNVNEALCSVWIVNCRSYCRCVALGYLTSFY